MRQSKRTDAVALLTDVLSQRWQVFSRRLALARRRPGERAIHGLRVAMRRLIAVLSSADTMLPASRYRSTIRVLRRTLKSFNELRDVQVQVLATRSLVRRFPALRTYRTELLRRKRALAVKARQAVRGLSAEDFVPVLARADEEMAAFFGSRPAQEAAGTLLKAAAARAFTKVLGRRAELSGTDPRSIHRMRVAFKNFRYTVEVVRPLLPWANKQTGKAMDEFQTMMGGIQDLEVLAADLRRFARKHPSAMTRLLPVISHLSVARKSATEEFLRRADEVLTFWR